MRLNGTKQTETEKFVFGEGWFKDNGILFQGNKSQILFILNYCNGLK